MSQALAPNVPPFVAFLPLIVNSLVSNIDLKSPYVRPYRFRVGSAGWHRDGNLLATGRAAVLAHVEGEKNKENVSCQRDAKMERFLPSHSITHPITHTQTQNWTKSLAFYGLKMSQRG